MTIEVTFEQNNVVAARFSIACACEIPSNGKRNVRDFRMVVEIPSVMRSALPTKRTCAASQVGHEATLCFPIREPRTVGIATSNHLRGCRLLELVAAKESITVGLHSFEMDLLQPPATLQAEKAEEGTGGSTSRRATCNLET